MSGEHSELQRQFLDQIETIISECTSADVPTVIALSGGIDSFILLAAFRRRFPDRPVRTLTVEGPERSDDSRRAAIAAEAFATEHHTVAVDAGTLLDDPSPLAGTRTRSLSRAISHLALNHALATLNPSGAVVLSGHGGDRIYGTTRFNYDRVDKALSGLTHPEFRARAGERYVIEPKSIGRHMIAVCTTLGATYYMPYRDPRLVIFADLPDEVIGPETKAFVRDALRRHYDLGDIVERPRMPLQGGLGLTKSFRRLLKDRYGQQGESARDVVARLSGHSGSSNPERPL